ncbi:hypothetical protein J8L85_09535 [Maribacter sp. MMG018]|uniref:hypothetical protein n=1 Tax=Maribacter sp. MMG018 TaxID=2822688 RepID=UPI001B37CAB9|nr:hypothetical protein [Maribacter sp. MMG018]MBQ4914675.1 hypothetical protein [Maribacter sp. MMG018]
MSILKLKRTVISEIQDNLKNYAYILVLFVLIVGCKKEMDSSQIITSNPTVLPFKKLNVAGDPIQLKFKDATNELAALIIENSLGTTVLKATKEENMFIFDVPKHITQKAGLCHWTLTENAQIKAKGSFNILPNPNNGTYIESYLGPRSITAVTSDFSMHVIAPTDAYDNPLSDGTKITSTYQFKDNISSNSITMKDLMGWKNIYAPQQAGRILVTATCNESNSKELTSIVYPGNAVDFTITYARNHDYADGNQTITFSSDIIKDVYGNVVSDGTLVNFVANNHKNIRLTANGTTLNGIAKARFIHPYEATEWKVKAYVTGAAQSKPISVSFIAAIKDYQITLTNDQRSISVENIQSFMDQIVPDGVPISMKLNDRQGEFVALLKETSRLGKAKFELSTEFYDAGEYSIETVVAGIVKKQDITLK